MLGDHGRVNADRWTQATVYPDMWVDPDDDPRESGVRTVGERDTLLVPGVSRYPSIAYGKPATATQVAPVTFSSATVAEPSNDEMERQAA